MIMDLRKREPLAKADTWLAYRCAFEDYSEKARRVQSLNSQPDPDYALMQTALLELEKALAEYRNSRDVVVQPLLPAPCRVAAA
jgi:hypothetical protein